MPALPLIYATTPLNEGGNGWLLQAGSDNGFLVNVNDFPSTLENVDTLTIRGDITYQGLSDDTIFIDVKITESGTGTVLAASNAAGDYFRFSAGTTNARVTEGPFNFPYVNTTATLAQWNNAVLDVMQIYDANMGGDGGQARVHPLPLSGTYTGPVEAHSSVIAHKTESPKMLSAWISAPADGSTHTVTDPLDMTLNHTGFVAAADWYVTGVWSRFPAVDNEEPGTFYPPDGSKDGSQPGDANYPNANYSDNYGPPDGVDQVRSGGIANRFTFGPSEVLGNPDETAHTISLSGSVSFIAHDIANTYSNGTFSYGPAGLYENFATPESRPQWTTVSQGFNATDRSFSVNFTGIPEPHCLQIIMGPGGTFGGDSMMDAIEWPNAVSSESIDSWRLHRDSGTTPWWNQATQSWQAAQANNPAFSTTLTIPFSANNWDTGGATTTFTFTVTKGALQTVDAITINNDGIVGTLVTIDESTHLHVAEQGTVSPQLPDTVFPSSSTHAIQSDEVSFTNQMIGQDSAILHVSEEAGMAYSAPQLMVNFPGHRLEYFAQDGTFIQHVAIDRSAEADSTSFYGLGLRPNTSTIYLTNPLVGDGRTLYLHDIETGARISTMTTNRLTGVFRGCQFDKQGRLWVYDSANKFLLRINLGTGAVEESVGISGDGPDQGNDMFAFDQYGHIWYYDGVNENFEQHNWPSNSLRRVWNYSFSGDQIAHPGMTFHRDGRMWLLHDPIQGDTDLRVYEQNSGTLLEDHFIQIGSGGLANRPRGSTFYPSSFGGLYWDTNISHHLHTSSEPIIIVQGVLPVDDSTHVVQSDEASVGRFILYPDENTHEHTVDEAAVELLPGPSLVGFFAQTGGNPNFVRWYDKDTFVSGYERDVANLPINTQRIAVDTNGQMWSVTFGGTLFRFDPLDPTATLEQIQINNATLSGTPAGLAFDPNNNDCWVLHRHSTNDDSWLIKIDMATGEPLVNTLVSGVDGVGLAVTYEGEFWINDTVAPRGIRVASETNGSVSAFIDYTQFSNNAQLFSLSLLPTGRVGALDSNTDDYYEIDTETHATVSTVDVTGIGIPVALSWSEHPLADGIIAVNDATHQTQSDEVALIPSFTTFTPTATATGVASVAAELSVSVNYGESYANLVMDFQNVSLTVDIDPAVGGGKMVTKGMRTISFNMRQPFLLHGQPYHPHGGTLATTVSSGSGTVIAPAAPETYSSGSTLPTQRWIVSDASISGGDNGGAKFNYITTWTPESGNTAWNFTVPGYPYRPFFGAYQYGGDNRPYKVFWPNVLKFAGRYDEFLQLNQTIVQPSTWMIVCWQIKLSGTATSYPIFNRFPVNVSAHGFPATVDPDFGFRIFERGTQEITVGNTATEINTGKDFKKEAIYTLQFDGNDSLFRYRDHDRMAFRQQPGGTGSSDGMIIGGSTDPNFLMFVPEVLYFNSHLSNDMISRWETHLFNKYSLGNLARE